jgi:hypothetical protein
MSWSYRILHDGRNFWVGEVYYDSAGNPESYTDASVDTLRWDNLNDLWGTIEQISQDTTRPVLKVDPVTEKITGEM